MSVFEAVQNRRSVRKYEDRAVAKEEVEKLLRAAMQAPSAGNQQPWEFIVVQDKATLARLAEAHVYAGSMKNAPLAIILLSDQKRLKYQGYWQQDLAAATENLLLAAVGLGLGAVWMGVAPEADRMDFIRKLFDLPEGIEPFAMISLGYSDENRFVDRYDANRVHYERYQR